MRGQNVADVIPISIAHAPSLLHHNNVGVTYVGISNLRMEPIRFIPLYFVAMFLFMIIITEAPFILAPIHTIVGVKSRPQNPRGKKLVSVHEKMPKDVNKVFAGQ
jgi:hypothetical protein